MSKNLIIILFILITVALSGCTDSGPSKETQVEIQKFDHANQNLDAKMVDIRFDRDDIRAGETVTSELFVANTGSEKIINETVEIEAKLKTLDDPLANIYLKTMSEEKKIRRIDPIYFETEIEPGTVKTISARFHTIKEMEKRSLAGTYEINITLSVNGQKVEGRIIPIKLYSGEVREITPTPGPSAILTPTPALTLTPALTPIPANTPEIIETVMQTSAPTPEPVVVATPSGKVIPTRVKSAKFMEPHLDIYAGDEVQWVNYSPDENYDIVEMDQKMPTKVLKSRISHIFNTTGDYKFGIYYRNMRGDPSIQTITVRINASNVNN